uniref:Uncharacterized protein n=1 Tax=Salvator merianae TaxID=96440 RepID=A0A8D0DMQ8_SALMN
MGSPPPPLLFMLLGLLWGAAGAGERAQHYGEQGEHRPDYDREALLGGQWNKMVSFFAKNCKNECKKTNFRLNTLIKSHILC